jgi:serine/threonine protein kinase
MFSSILNDENSRIYLSVRILIASRQRQRRVNEPRIVTDPVGQLNGVDQREQNELLDALKRATIGEYDVYSPLGRGGMATVFLALELALNRPVAIKVISPSAMSSSTVIERFWLEARTAASLSHPHVIPIFAVRAVGGLHFFVMKHVQGGSLDGVLKSEGPFSFHLARTILMQVSSALAYAHRRGVVHRDIKPANIMLDDEGYAVVMDFGIAKVRDVAALTASGAMVGTPSYMSPEQFSGEVVDGRTDQYSLGIVAFELITGSKPFRGRTVPELLRGHLFDKAPDIRELRPECPTSLATLINRMMRKSASDRFPSMEAICAQLELMPRMNTDRIREKIVSLAKTASLSNPQISEPVSPTPPPRISSIESERLASSPEPKTKKTKKNYRRAVWIGGTLLGLSGAALASAMRWTRFPENENSTSELLAPIIVAAARPIAVLDTTKLVKPDSAASNRALPIIEAPKPTTVAKSVTRTRRSKETASAQNEDTRAVASDSMPTLNLSAIIPFNSPPPAPIPSPRPATAFKVGSRLPQAVFYIDGEVMGMRSGRTTFVHAPGVVHLQIKAEDCASYDTVFVLIEGDTAQIGWRNPKCR